jgi:hypothetical protein
MALRTLGRCKQYSGIGEIGFDISTLMPTGGGGGAAAKPGMMVAQTATMAIPGVGPIVSTLLPSISKPFSKLLGKRKKKDQDAELPVISATYYAAQPSKTRKKLRKYFMFINEDAATWARIRYMTANTQAEQKVADKLSPNECGQVENLWKAAGSPKKGSGIYFDTPKAGAVPTAAPGAVPTAAPGAVPVKSNIALYAALAGGGALILLLLLRKKK